jgi:hypothetical protein
VAHQTSKPETLIQAAEWQRATNRYVSHGLCDRCDAQAAWAHQDMGDSWTTIHPPCDYCTHIVAAFPHPTPCQDWRKTLRQRDNPALLDAPELREAV